MMFDYEKVEQAVKLLLEGFGEDINREGLKETPRRVAGYWKELLDGMNYTNKQIADKYSKKFVVDNDPLVVKEIKNVYSHCEHHLALMYNMTVIVAYIPVKTKEGKYQVIGISKIPRIVDLCSKRLQLQEKLASDIAECISLATGSDDVYVNIVADHACVSARGAKSDGITDVTFLQGDFKTNKALRDEVERKINRYHTE
jgi:GTP cyclohydrolase I